jgi:hypothetical protein
MTVPRQIEAHMPDRRAAPDAVAWIASVPFFAVHALALATPLCAHAACSASNGDPVQDPVYDASPLDVVGNPNDPETGGKLDGSTKDVASDDAPSDAPKDAKDGAPNTAPVRP